MRVNRWPMVTPLLLVVMMVLVGCGVAPAASSTAGEIIALPTPVYDGDSSLEEALLARRSVREYSERPVALEQLGQLLWAAQGITDPDGKRTAPSAGGLYPLSVFVVVGEAEGLSAGVYVYHPEGHTLERTGTGDMREALAEVAVGQSCVRDGAVDIVIAAEYEITTIKYGERGIRYVYMEAGHAAQNICLQAVALDLGAVTVGAFDDADVQRVLGLDEDMAPLYIIPVGHPTEQGG